MPAHTRARRPLVAALCIALSIAACSEGPTRPGGRLPPAAALQAGTGADASAACSPVAHRPFLANQDLPVGSIDVANDEATLFITMRTEGGWTLDKTHVFVGTDAADIPISNGGNPTPGKFTFSARHVDGTTEYTYAAPLSELGGETTAVISAHADVLLGDEKEGAWADGTSISEGGSWGTYFTYDIVDCLSQLVSVDAGGTLALGDVTFSVPPGAVQQDVQITIRPIDVSELNLPGASSIASASGPAAGGNVPADIDLSSVIPVPGTAYELGPTGLVFDPDALPTITIHYEEDEVVAAGLVESLLHVLILDGIFDDAGGVVDEDANTVTAQVPHFSQIFLGAAPPTFADLETRELYQSPIPGKVGSRLEFSTDVVNHGPDATTGAAFTYVAFGDVVLGDVFGSCAEIPDPIYGDVAIQCDVAPLAPDQNDGIETFQLIPQSPGSVTVWATVGAVTGAVDLVSDNDRAEITADVEPAVLADLAVTELTPSDDTARIGASLEYQAKIENLGPDAVSGGSATWAASGAVELGTIPSGCTELGAADLTFYDVGIRCDIAALGPGEQATLPMFRISPTAQGDVLIDVGIATLSGETEADASNNFAQTTTTILPDADVDYALQSLVESADPVKAYEPLTYTGVVALNAGPLTPVDGGTYQLFVDGQFGVLSMSPGCTKLERTVPAGANFTCDLGSMDTGTSKSFAIVLEPHAAPQTISAQAGITAPITVNETNPGDETGAVATTVDALSADLFLTLLTDDPDPVEEGSIVTYGVYALSGGSDDDMPRVVVQFRVAGDAQLVSMPPDFAASCTDLSGASTADAVVVNCDIEPLQAGIASPHLEFGVRALSGPELSAEAEVFPVDAYAVDPDGSNNVQSQTTTVSGTPAQPTGTLVFSSNRNTGSLAQLYTKDLATGTVTRITDFANFADAQWSPDGTRIAAIRGASMWIMDADGGNALEVRLGDQDIVAPGNPSWAPDGSKIVFHGVYDFDPQQDLELWVYDVASTGVTRLTDNTVDDAFPDWSPDGTSIAYVVDESAVWTIEPNGTFPLERLSRSGVRHPDWSPDGLSIALTTAAATGSAIEVFRIDDPAGITTLVDDGRANVKPAWSPDGMFIAFAKDQVDDNESFDLYYVAAAGNGTQQLLEAVSSFSTFDVDWK